MKVCAIALILFGCILFGIGMSMRTKQNAFTHLETEIIKGNRTGTTTTGALIGTGVGAATGATIGGIGIAMCGTGIGIPAGIVCLGTAAICGLIGAGAGAAVGKPDETITKPVTEMVNAYSPGEYWTVITIGALLIGIGLNIFCFSKKLIITKK